MRQTSEDDDLIAQIGDFVLMLVVFGALRETLRQTNLIVFRLIDLVLAAEPLPIAEQLNRASDPRWSVSVLLVSLPVFLVAFRIFSSRLERSRSLRHSKLFIFFLVLLILDTIVIVVTSIPVFLFSFIAAAGILSSLLKTMSLTIVYGAFLTYLVSELRMAASE